MRSICRNCALVAQASAWLRSPRPSSAGHGGPIGGDGRFALSILRSPLTRSGRTAGGRPRRMEIDSVERLRPVRSLVLPASAVAGGGQAHPARPFEALTAGPRLGAVAALHTPSF